MSKGSKQRPAQVPQEQVEDNWEKTFGKGSKPDRPAAPASDQAPGKGEVTWTRLEAS